MPDAGRALVLVRLTGRDRRATVESAVTERWSADPGPGPGGRPAGVDVHWSVDPDGRQGRLWVESADVLRCGRAAPGTGAAVRRVR
ncbi:hypothetical protein, partial [Streptomyces sp. ISL-11]|uniref:hypothetical protein n=1 Tax=Streptomyces sp. ISL-11 TaxID=2819174 RepID=UPI001BE525C6